MRKNTNFIPCLNPLAEYKKYRKEINLAIKTVLESGYYIQHTQTQLFEKEFADFIGVKHSVAVGNGTEAIQIALKALGLKSQDEVITVSHTATATVAAITLAGARPVLIDIEPDYYTLDPNKLKKAITHKTKAIIIVHLYGQPANLPPILEIAKQHGIFIIEDCAQAHGAQIRYKRVGSFGDFGCFSFYPTKNLGAMGDAGMITTNSKNLAEKARLIRQYGWKKRHISSLHGMNSRLDEIQAAILRVKLRHLNKRNTKRTKIASLYNSNLLHTNLTLPKARKHSTHAFHLYVVRLKKRDLLQKHLKNKGIQTLIHYPTPVHLQPAYKKNVKLPERPKVTETIAKQVLSIPIYPELKHSHKHHVIKTIINFSNRY